MSTQLELEPRLANKEPVAGFKDGDDTPYFPRPTNIEERDFRRSLIGLKFRTITVGILGFISLTAAAFLFFGASQELGRQFSQVATAYPPIHIPHVITSGGINAWLPRLLYLMLGFVIVAFSTGILSRRQWVGAAFAVGLLMAAELWFCPDERRPFLVFPSHLENSLRAHKFGHAEKILNETRADAISKNYVIAQIALHNNDEMRLKEVAQPILNDIESVVYRTVSESMRNLLASVGPFRAEVIHALDSRINGRPLTSVGIEYELRQKSVRNRPILSGAAKGAAAISFAFFAIGFGFLWTQMRKRVEEIQSLLRLT